MDWTSIHFEAQTSSLIQYGIQPRSPARPPADYYWSHAGWTNHRYLLGSTIQPGNINDQTHFKHTYHQIQTGFTNRVVSSCLMLVPPAGLTLIFWFRITCGISPGWNWTWVMSTSISTRSTKMNWTRIVTGNKDEEVYGKKLVFPSRIKYLYFSQRLYDDIMKNRRKHLEQEYDEALSLRKTIETGKKPRRKYRNSNHFLQTHLSYTFPLTGLSREEAIEYALQQINHEQRRIFLVGFKQGFLTSRSVTILSGKRTVLRKCFIAWKTRIHLRPTWCWTQEAVYGSILIVFLAQLVSGMLRYMALHRYVVFRQNSSCKAWKISHLPLLLVKTGWENMFFSNFDWINRLVFCGKDPWMIGFFQPGFWLKTM